MQKHERLALEVVKRHVPTDAVCSFHNGKKHPHILIELGPRSFKLTVASSPRTDTKNQENYVRQGIRRLMGEMK